MYMYTCTHYNSSAYSQSALSHELTDKLHMAVRGESKTTTTATPTRAKTNALDIMTNIRYAMNNVR